MSSKTDIKPNIRDRVRELLAAMTVPEKIGQLSLHQNGGESRRGELIDAIRQGNVGGIINEVDANAVRELQRVAVEESRLGIPLLFGRDVVHGFKSIFPIPLGLASCWSRDLVRRCARASALEAAASGINWTYAPMLDIGRDPRWGRVAETFGEDPYLIAELAREMVAGFQGEDLSRPENIAACAKHFIGNGASESGRDYNTTNIPMNELYNVHLRPFRAAVSAGVASVMTSFSDFDGVPVSANRTLLDDILRRTLGFHGIVVSDWESINQLKVHGLTESDKESAYEAATAGVDMEMTSRTYANHLEELLQEGRVTLDQLDQMVTHVLMVKARLGLFEHPYTTVNEIPVPSLESSLRLAYEAAVQSVVLLQNSGSTLPIDMRQVKSLAVIGPMANEGYEQLGTWVFDGDPALSRTPLQELKERFSDRVRINYARGTESTRTNNHGGFAEAVHAASESDCVILFLGEESILSGEAHCRANIRLPGAQEELVARVADTGKPMVAVVMAGRPLIMRPLLDRVSAVLYAWHPGNMAGPALVDLITGLAVPSGKLPISFPRMTGQIPIYCAHKNTGRPVIGDDLIQIDDIEKGATQTSVGNMSYHLDAGYEPEFPLGFGLSYTRFVYSNIRLSSQSLRPGETVQVSAELRNNGGVKATEVVQLYVRDLVGSVTRPVKELRGFQRVTLEPGEVRIVYFTLSAGDLAFYDRSLQLITEPGIFHVWIGGSSDTTLRAEFEMVEN